MTREEAKDYIREWCPYDRQEEIIKALEQEPCGDAISRQAVLDLPKNIERGFGGRILEQSINIEYIKALPPVTPQSCTDAISRQVVLDVIEREEFKGDALSEINKLPPVTPQSCTDAISREVVLDYIRDNYRRWFINDDAFMQCMNGIKDIMISVTPAEKIGHWGKEGECPFCGYFRKWEDDNFCGHCGAKMIEPQESEVMGNANGNN